MTVTASSAGFTATCPCGWATLSQTRAVVERRLSDHTAMCGEPE